MKKLFLLPLLALMLAGCGGQGGGQQQEEGKSVSFTAGEVGADTASFAAKSYEKEGVKVDFSAVKAATWSVVKDGPKLDQLRVTKDSTMTVSVAGKSVVKIEFTCQLPYVGDTTSYYGADGFVANPEGTFAHADAGAENVVSTWTGEGESIVFTASGHQVRLYSFVVTYK